MNKENKRNRTWALNWTNIILSSADDFSTHSTHLSVRILRAEATSNCFVAKCIDKFAEDLVMILVCSRTLDLKYILFKVENTLSNTINDK